MDSSPQKRDDLNYSNGGWSRSDFSDRYDSAYRNGIGHMSRSLSHLEKRPDPTYDERRYDKLSPAIHLNGKQHPRYAGYDRNLSSVSDTTVIEDNDETHPSKSLKTILSKFAERTSCVGPPYINSSNHFYSKFFWSIIFVGMIVATVVNVYLNVATFNERPIKTTVSIGYTSLTFPMVTICNSNAVRKSTLKLASEDLQEFVNLQDPLDLERQPGPQGPSVASRGDGSSGQTTGGQNTGQNTGGQNTGQNTIGQNTDQTTGGQNTGQTTGGQNTGQKTGRQNTGPNAGGTNTGPTRNKRFVDQFQRQQKIGNKTFRPPKKDIAEHLGGESDPRFESKEEFRYLIGQEAEKIRYEMAHQIDDMLLSCSLEGRSCEAGNFTRFLSDEYGVCYSFNQVRFGITDLESIRKSYRRGNEYGLQMIFFLEVDEYVPGITLGYGARVTVTHPTIMPFPGVDGLFVASGSELDIGVKMINISRLGKPYGLCTDPETFSQKYGFAYSRQGCQSICPHSLILEYCNCFDPAQRRLYPLNSTADSRACNATADYECVSNVEYMYTIEQNLTCDCPNPCSETTYDLMISSREWPEDTYMYALTDAICRRPGGSDVCEKMLMKSPAEQRRNFLKLNVFYRDLNYETLQEEPDYPESQFLSDLGGSIGLWVGLSVMSMAEVLEIVVAIIVWLFRKCFRCEKKPTGRRHGENGHAVGQGSNSKDSITPRFDGITAVYQRHPNYSAQAHPVELRPDDTLRR